jgi:hypothetical protein
MRILPFLLLAISTPALAEERRFTVTDFDRVVVEGPYQVTLRTGNSPAARVSGDRQGVARVAIDVQGRTLRVRSDRSAWGGFPRDTSGPVQVEIATHELKSAAVLGPGGLSIDRMKGMRLDLSLEGSGSLSVAGVESDHLTLGLLGSGRMNISGKARQLRVNVQGSGDLNAAALIAEDAHVTSETSGTLQVGAKRSAKVNATGSGETRILGRPACTVNAIGSGRVACGSP